MYRGIPFRTFFVTIFLVTFVLLIVVLSSLRGHQAAMRDLVAERDLDTATCDEFDLRDIVADDLV